MLNYYLNKLDPYRLLETDQLDRHFYKFFIAGGMYFLGHIVAAGIR